MAVREADLRRKLRLPVSLIERVEKPTPKKEKPTRKSVKPTPKRIKQTSASTTTSASTSRKPKPRRSV
jgi:hypothetical protein